MLDEREIDTEGLPRPDPAARERSEELVRRIRSRIVAAGGAIDFSEFMDAALYAPGLGYYRAGIEAFGAGGDFTTAPEISPVLGRCAARQTAEVLENLSEGEVLELGAGSGRLAAQLLTTLSELGRLPTRYRILETSARLRTAQHSAVRPVAEMLGVSIEWLERLPEQPFEGVILSNEVVDALPVSRFSVVAGGVRALGVQWDENRGRLRDVLYPVPDALASALDEIPGREALPVGYTSEIRTLSGPWVASLAACLARGVLLVLDYGYERRDFYHPQRVDGTLLCHYRHRVHADPYVLVGLQDITASVDFTSLARAGLAAGLDLAGYTTQAWFLLSMGVEDIAATAARDDPARYPQLASQLRRLMLPGEMGERVKLLGFSRGLGARLSAFGARDLRNRL